MCPTDGDQVYIRTTPKTEVSPLEERAYRARPSGLLLDEAQAQIVIGGSLTKSAHRRIRKTFTYILVGVHLFKLTKGK